ncbi:efflux transporter outer membrane subunit [Faecalibacter rhinopitheci]|uniref:Efflux transporter outer membrane subunit n=1 Tax=Faecalibacter rhinopitheci TaxID=2779678 RepID=A0A8J7G3C4_9FLAO|nr:efflux transporter outer membrane subunit [Faecalibacter rhinopitheci]MBF0596012.1 efflux transporter outer membrane subunit [Faecalibacter rhinopitheci]
MKKFRILKVSLIAFGLFSIQSCFVAKDYTRPGDVQKEAQFRTDIVASQDQTIADVSWQEFFSDPTLKAYITKGLQNNLDIRTALQNIAVTEAYVKQGKAGYLPTLSVGPGYTYTKTSANTQFGRITGSQSLSQYDVTGNFSWEADIWGKIRSNYRGATANYLQTVEAHKAVQTNIVSTIANTYYQLIALDEQKKAIVKTIGFREQSLETIKALKEAGNVTQVAVNQTEAQLFNAKALLVDVDANIKLNENVLSVLLGETPQVIERGTIENQQIYSSLGVGLPAQILENRPDVKAAEFALVNAFENVNIANANFYPSLSLTATGGLQGIDIDKLFDAQSLFANVVARLAQPILQKRQIKTAKEVALANEEKALLAYKQTILTASKEVSDALARYEAADQKIPLKDKEAELYNQSIEYSEELLAYGMANYLEVITAREAALNAELNAINARLTKLNSVVELYRSVGGGWK